MIRNAFTSNSFQYLYFFLLFWEKNAPLVQSRSVSPHDVETKAEGDSVHNILHFVPAVLSNLFNLGGGGAFNTSYLRINRFGNGKIVD